MMLDELLREVGRSSGGVTIGELAKRLGVSPGTVTAMLAALRATGRLASDGSARPGPAGCGAYGACSMACPGPATCPFIVDLGTVLELP